MCKFILNIDGLELYLFHLDVLESEASNVEDDLNCELNYNKWDMDIPLGDYDGK